MNLYLFSPLDQFEILCFLPLSFFGLLDISLTNGFLFMLLIFLFLFLFIGLGITKLTIITNNFFYSIFEFIYLFVFNIVKQQSGLQAQGYFPYFILIFFFILLSNLFGLFPFGFTVTSHIVITFFIAFSFNVSFLIFGLYKHQIKFFKLFLPQGVPTFLIPLIVVIEVISYLLRTFSLSIRLFANMMAGHTLMFILSSFIISFLNMGFFGILPSIVVFILLFFVFILEFGIAFLQAYVFVILLSIYVRDSVSPSH